MNNTQFAQLMSMLQSIDLNLQCIAARCTPDEPPAGDPAPVKAIVSRRGRGGKTGQ